MWNNFNCGNPMCPVCGEELTGVWDLGPDEYSGVTRTSYPPFKGIPKDTYTKFKKELQQAWDYHDAMIEVWLKVSNKYTVIKLTPKGLVYSKEIPLKEEPNAHS